MGRKVDEKARLAPGIAVARYGWKATSVGRIVVMPDTRRLRRLVERHAVIGRMFPVDAVTVRRWLRMPAGEMAGLWFMSDIARETGRQASMPVARRVRPRSSVDRTSRTPATRQTGVGSAGSGRAQSAGD
jgi:hypothetical protein